VSLSVRGIVMERLEATDARDVWLVKQGLEGRLALSWSLNRSVGGN
jgi:hypothetical protein